MSDGNQVRVSLSQITEKVPYYPSIAKQLQAPQVIDMEAGIYAKPKEDYLADLKILKEIRRTQKIQLKLPQPNNKTERISPFSFIILS